MTRWTQNEGSNAPSFTRFPGLPFSNQYQAAPLCVFCHILRPGWMITLQNIVSQISILLQIRSRSLGAMAIPDIQCKNTNIDKKNTFLNMLMMKLIQGLE